MRRNRSSFTFPDFSLRRLLLQARAARGSPTLNGNRCDIEKGGTSKSEKSSTSASSNKHNNNNDTSSQCSGATSSHMDRISFVFTEKSPKCRNKAQSTSNSQQQQVQQQKSTENPQECQLCYMKYEQPDEMYTMLNCQHIACRVCLESYLTIEITESRTDIACPQCTESMHPSDIQILLKLLPNVIAKYEDFMVRRVLLADPDSRWCPAPDCGFAVIATGCASCPRLKCERPGCNLQFCYHCKAEWHPDATCDDARKARRSPSRQNSGSQDSQNRDDIKPCPRCQVLIVKIDDGSCNHMVCAVCGSEFCWLCKKEITDLHYLSPSGCTFWGTKPWSRKKKLLWQLGTLVGAPVMIALVAGIAVPAMIIGIPVWVGRKLHTRYKGASKHKRNCAVLGGVAASMLVSPVLAGLAVAIGVPILLFYVYGVVPVSLCRAGCGVSRDGVKFDFEIDEEVGNKQHADTQSVDAVSRIGATSIGEVSLSVASHLGVGSSNAQNASVRESTTALAGSIYGHKLEVQADVSETASAVTCVSEKSGTASTKALAGSILSYKPTANCDQVSSNDDGTSERVRFDNMIYVLEGQAFQAPLDQDMTADKASLGSTRSFRSSDLDSTSISSMHKRIIQRIPNKLNATQHRTMSLDSNSGSNNIPETLEPEEQIIDMPPATITQDYSDTIASKLSPASSTKEIKSKSPQPAKKELSKTSILRSIFFSGSSNSKS